MSPVICLPADGGVGVVQKGGRRGVMAWQMW